MELKFESTKKEKSKVLLTITVDKSEIQNEYKKGLDETKKNMTMPGFRKGMVPQSIIEMKFKTALVAEAGHKLMDKAYQEVMPKLEAKPLAYGTPELTDVKEIDLDKDLVFQIEYETYPEITIGEYKNVEIEKDEVAVEDSDIEEELKRYMSEFSSIEVKEGKIGNDDIVLVEYKVYETDKEIDNMTNEYIHIGKDYDKYKIGSEIKGLSKDESKTFTKKFDDKNIETIANKELKFELKVKEIKHEKFPEMNDELAKKIDNTVNTIDELKTKIKSNLSEYAENITKQKGVDKILDVLIKTFKGDIPEVMINSQIDSFYNDLLRRSGNDEKRTAQMLKLEGLTKESYREKMKDKAEETVKKSLILNEITKKENFKVEEDEIKAHIGKFSKYYNINPDELFETYKKNGNLAMFENEILIEKAMDFIFKNAKSKKVNKLKIKDLN